MDFEHLYEKAGEVTIVEDDKISLERHSEVLSDEVADILDKVLEENPLPFELADFQTLAIHALGSMRNVILISPTGSGKMLVAYLAILVLQKKLGIPSGVGIGTQPLSSIMNEKVKNTYLSTGTISMQGCLQSSAEFADTEDDGGAVLSTSIEEFKSGNINCVIGHAESWKTKAATEILDSLQEKELILFSFVDEAHVPLKDHWDGFRPEMRVVSGQLRGKTIRGAPCLAMTATLTPSEVGEVKGILGLRDENTVVLRGNPIQRHHKYNRLVISYNSRKF